MIWVLFPVQQSHTINLPSREPLTACLGNTETVQSGYNEVTTRILWLVRWLYLLSPLKCTQVTLLMWPFNNFFVEALPGLENTNILQIRAETPETTWPRVHPGWRHPSQLPASPWSCWRCWWAPPWALRSPGPQEAWRHTALPSSDWARLANILANF